MLALASSLSPELKKRFEKRNASEQQLVDNSVRFRVGKAFPYLAGKIHQQSIIDELEYIRVMYEPPLSTEQRLRLRKTIERIIDINDLSVDVIEGLVKLLEEHGAI